MKKLLCIFLLITMTMALTNDGRSDMLLTKAKQSYSDNNYSNEIVYLKEAKLVKLKKEVKSKLQDVEESKAYNKTITVSGMEDYIVNYPNNPKVDKIKNRLEENYYKLIKDSSSRYLVLENDHNLMVYEHMRRLQYAIKYLKLFPNGKYVEEIKAKDFFLINMVVGTTSSSKQFIRDTYEYINDFTVLNNDDYYSYRESHSNYQIKLESMKENPFYNSDGRSIVNNGKYISLYYDIKGRLIKIRYNKEWFYYTYQGHRLISSRSQLGTNEMFPKSIKNHIYKYNSERLLVQDRFTEEIKHNGKKIKMKGYVKFSYDDDRNLSEKYSKKSKKTKKFTYDRYRVGENGKVTKVSLAK